MARPRVLSDDEVLDRLAAFLTDRRSVEPWTLAEAGARIGMTSAGLVKRFGSRQGLVAALSDRWVRAIPAGPVRPGDVESELLSWVTDRGASQAQPLTLATRLAQLVGDLSDPVLAGLLVEGWRREQAYVASLLALHDLRRLPDPAQGAALLFDALCGANLRAGAGDPAHTDPERVLQSFLEVWR